MRVNFLSKVTQLVNDCVCIGTQGKETQIPALNIIVIVLHYVPEHFYLFSNLKKTNKQCLPHWVVEVAVQWTLAFFYLELWDLIKLNQSELRSSWGQGSILWNDLNFIPCFSNWWIAPQWPRCSLDTESSLPQKARCVVDPQTFKHVCFEWLKTFKRALATFCWQQVFP